MKSKLLALLLVLMGIGNASGQSRQKKVLFVIVDGISADTKEQLKTPNLDAISGAGGYSRAYVGGVKGTYSQTPTISAVGYNSLLTGTWVNKHNVWDNSIKEPNYHYRTIFRWFKEQFPSKRTAVFSSWQDNRTKLVGENLPATGFLTIDYSLDGLELDLHNYPHDDQSEYIHKIDERIVDEASTCIREKAPDLTWLYLEYTDDMGHKFGDGEQLNRAVGLMDNQMGRIWKAVKYREEKFNEDWLVLVTTDHGRDAVSGKGHGGQSERERNTWIVTNAKKLNTAFTRETPAIVDLFPTIARHLGVNLPKYHAFELDGVPLTGQLSVYQPKVSKIGEKVSISWKHQNSEGTVKVWVAATNHFEAGGQDLYYLMGEVPAASDSLSFSVSHLPRGFLKIVIEGKYNAVNRWIVE